MDTRLHGFRLGSTEMCSLQDLSTYLAAISGTEFEFSDRPRIFFAGMRDERCVGVLLTLKDQRRFPQIEQGEDVRLYVHEAEEGRTPFDFNFFAFDPTSGGGVYQHYIGSCSIHRFGHLLGRLYDDIARNCCTGDKNTLLNRASGRRIRKDQLDFAVVLRRDSFEEQIRNLTRATLFEYDIVSQEDMTESLQPLKKHAKLERRTIRFKAGTSGQSIVEAVMDLIPLAKNRGKFRVAGTDAEGDFHNVDYLAPPRDEFAKDDVDSLTDEMILRFSDITQSPYVETMLQVMAENPALLGREEDA